MGDKGKGSVIKEGGQGKFASVNIRNIKVSLFLIVILSSLINIETKNIYDIISLTVLMGFVYFYKSKYIFSLGFMLIYHLIPTNKSLEFGLGMQPGMNTMTLHVIVIVCMLLYYIVSNTGNKNITGLDKEINLRDTDLTIGITMLTLFLLELLWDTRVDRSLEVVATFLIVSTIPRMLIVALIARVKDLYLIIALKTIILMVLYISIGDISYNLTTIISLLIISVVAIYEYSEEHIKPSKSLSGIENKNS